MFNRIWATFKAKAPLLPHLVTAARWKACGGRKEYLCLVLFPLHPTLEFSCLCILQDWIKRRVSKFHLVVMDTIHHGSLWDGRSPLLTLSFDGHFCEFWGDISYLEHFSKLPWWRQCLSPPTGFPQFLPQPLAIWCPLPQASHGIWDSSRLVPAIGLHEPGEILTHPCLAAGGYIACSQCSLTCPPPHSPHIYLIWSELLLPALTLLRLKEAHLKLFRWFP